MQATAPSIETRTLAGHLFVAPGCTLEYRIEYPHLPAYASLSRHYAAWAVCYVRSVGSHFLPVLRRLPEGARGERPHIEGRLEVALARPDLLSLCIELWEDFGFCHRTVGRHADLWRLPEERRLGLADLFHDPAAVRSLISAAVEREIAEAPPGRYHAGWRQAPRWFFLTERGLCVYFRPGDITAPNGGIPTFFIPYEKLRAYAKIPL